MKNYLIKIFLVWTLTYAWHIANADEVKLLPITDSKNIATVISERALQNKLSDVVILNKQSFHIMDDNKSIGTLVSGRGLLSDEGRENSTCFVAMLKQGAIIDLLLTIGVDEWEAESCIDVNAVGLITKESVGGQVHIGVVYKAASPNSDVSEPVVLSWDIPSQRLKIDLESSKKASLSGATTIPTIRKALKKALYSPNVTSPVQR